MKQEELRKLMENIQDSYDDFVNCTVRWMIRDGKIQNEILTLLRDKPQSSTSDILELLCDCLGIGAPLELVDDDEEELYTDPPQTDTRMDGKVSVAY